MLDLQPHSYCSALHFSPAHSKYQRVSDVKDRLNYLAMGVFEGINFYIAEKLVKDAPQVDSR